MPKTSPSLDKRFQIALFEYGETEFACGEWSADDAKERFETLHARAIAARRRVIRLFHQTLRQDRKEEA